MAYSTWFCHKEISGVGPTDGRGKEAKEVGGGGVRSDPMHPTRPLISTVGRSMPSVIRFHDLSFEMTTIPLT